MRLFTASESLFTAGEQSCGHSKEVSVTHHSIRHPVSSRLSAGYHKVTDVTDKKITLLQFPQNLFQVNALALCNYARTVTKKKLKRQMFGGNKTKAGALFQ